MVLVFSQLEQSNRELGKAIEENLRVSAKITNAVIPKLYSLEECLNDLTERVYGLTRRDEMTVRHIGLDMHDAWHKLEAMLLDPRLQMNINYQLLVITSQSAKLGEVDEEIMRWCDYVGAHALPKIKRDVPLFGKTYSEAGRRLQFAVKEYVYSPFLHGFQVQGPIDICYMAICRWKSKGDSFEFDWGDRTYFRLIKQNADPIQGELYRVFASTFERHWGTNPVASFQTDNKGPISTAH